MFIPCSQRITCPCDPLPLSNYSSEDPDRLVFLGRNYGYSLPSPVNVQPLDDGCTTFSSSPQSQQDADECAAASNQECQTGQDLPNPCDICNPSSGGSSLGISFGFVAVPAGSGSGAGSDPCCDPDAPEGCCCQDECGNANCDPPPPPPPPPHGDPPSNPETRNPPRTFCNTPQSCTVTCDNGAQYTATVESGRFCSVSQAMANQMAHDAACRQAEEMKDCRGGGGAGCDCIVLCLDSPADQQLGTAPEEGEEKTFELLSDLPDGLSMDSSGKITGTPTIPGNGSIDVKITNSEGKSVILHTCLSVLGITTVTLPDGAVGTPYVAQLTASGGEQPYMFLCESDLPTGITLNPTNGQLTGTPDTGGSYTPVFRVVDTCGASCAVQLELFIDGTTNTPQTVNSPCTSNPALSVSVTVPTGTVWHPPGYDQKLANAEARLAALQQAASALAANGCPCYMQNLATDNQHTGLATAHMTQVGCSLTLVAYSESFVVLAPNVITPFTLTTANPTFNLDGIFDTFGPGAGSNWPSAVTWALYIPNGVPAIADNVLFWYRHLAH